MSFSTLLSLLLIPGALTLGAAIAAALSSRVKEEDASGAWPAPHPSRHSLPIPSDSAPSCG